MSPSVSTAKCTATMAEQRRFNDQGRRLTAPWRIHTGGKICAAGDYYSCDVCGGKCFYDANLNYEWPDKTRQRLVGLPHPC
uniref:Uncharacterized protein n=1 Tax=Pseudomonas phage PACT201 TaxID=3230130 RepID=A0AAU8GTU7_9VIRU